MQLTALTSYQNLDWEPLGGGGKMTSVRDANARLATDREGQTQAGRGIRQRAVKTDVDQTLIVCGQLGVRHK